ncbi:AP-4 complex accessory subunit RUSC2 [Stigmatopora argus]
MDGGSDQRSGETLIVRHVPLVHCQVSGPPGHDPFCPPENLGLSRTTSLPERDVLQREALLYSSLIQTATVSDDSSPASSISDEQLAAAMALTFPRVPSGSRPPPRRNPFLIKTEEYYDEDERPGGGYGEDSPFRPSIRADSTPPSFRLHDPGAGRDPAAPVRRHGSAGSDMSVDCAGHEWEDDEDGDHPMPCGRGGETVPSASPPRRRRCRTLGRSISRDFPECYGGSDSSCNSSDSVLVNFSAIYNETDNSVLEKPANLNGPAEGESTGGAFYLDLLASPTDPACYSLAGEPPADLELDANCNAYGAPERGSTSVPASRPVGVPAQNYYKLVTCDLSSQSSPSPGSSERSGGSPPSPTRPSEYFLFRQRTEREEEEDSMPSDFAAKYEEEDEDEEAADVVLRGGQVYVNASLPQRSRSYDRQMDKSPGRPGPLERMASCPVRLSEEAGPPARVTSFAEIARSKRRHVNSSPLKADAFSPTESWPTWEGGDGGAGTGGGGHVVTGEPAAEGGPAHPAVVRYSKDRRPTSLPIQPFTFHHQLAPKAPQPKNPLPPSDPHASVAGPRPSSGGTEDWESQDSGEKERPRGRANGEAAPPRSVRPSPLGSHSPARLREGTCPTCSPSTSTPHGREPPDVARSDGKRGVAPPASPHVQQDTLSPLETLAEGSRVVRMHNAHHLSPQALKWREYRRQNPLGGERAPSVSSTTDFRRPLRRNVFDFPPSHVGQPTGRHYVKQMQPSCNDFLPDYFSLTERPPDEFCLSPDASTSSSFSSSAASQPQTCVDMTHKRGLVKAVNTAVDLIVAHFGTSRDPDVKAKLGNSWVSPNVGHLILKYLCPALREVLQDGLKAYVLDLIVGQRRCQPWSLVEASSQLGPSTRVLHKLLTKVNQFSELTSHSMRLNAFILGLLNIKSLEFWFSHLLTHEDIIGAHYNAWGLVPLAQGTCRQLFSELLLLLQPLSLLPFDLDLLFEYRLMATGREQQRRRQELLRSAGRSATRSTLELMKGWGAAVGDMVTGKGREGTRPRTDTPGRECVPEERGTAVRRVKGVGRESEERDPAGKDNVGSEEGRQRQDRQAGWWYQLMQSSQVYIDQSAEGSKFVKADKRRASAERRRPPPAREGVVEGAESGYGERPSWMGSPPESVLNREATEARPDHAARGQAPRWGRLFGSPTKTDAGEIRAKTPKSRPPSGWLGLDSSVLDLMAQTVGGGGGKKVESVAADPPSPEAKLSTCEVRALCHHIATETGQLSFSKGDILRVLSKADADWLLCSAGTSRGLVPMVYVSVCEGDHADSPGQR